MCHAVVYRPRDTWCRSYQNRRKLSGARPLSGLNRIDTLRNCVGRHDRNSLQHRVTRESVQANNSWCRSDQGISIHASSVRLNSTETSLSAAGSEVHKNRDTRWKRLADVSRDGITGITLCILRRCVCGATSPCSTEAKAPATRSCCRSQTMILSLFDEGMRVRADTPR